jgi:hypothetical protein
MDTADRAVDGMPDHPLLALKSVEREFDVVVEVVVVKM